MMLPHEQPIPGPASDFAASLQAQLPCLETDRLVLRAPELSDFDAYAEVALGPSGKFFLEEQTREAAWYDFTNMVATWMLRGHGVWTVTVRETDDVLGFVLIGFEPGDHEPELGYIFRRTAEGKGYAFEAATAVLDHAWTDCKLASLVSTIDHDNIRSMKLSKRLGGVRDGAAEAAHNHEIAVFRYSKPGNVV